MTRITHPYHSAITSLALAALAAIMLAGAPVLAQQADVFTYEDVFELEQAVSPDISPDGERIVYVRRSMDIMTDRPRGNLWIINRDGSGHRPLESGVKNYSSPVWSPDGTRIAFISNEEGRSQIYIRWMDTGQTARVTNLVESPSGLSWSPDGTQLAFTMFVPKADPSLISMPRPPEGANWAAPAREIDTLQYRFDGRGYLEEGFSHVFVVPATGGTPRQVTDGEFNHNGTPVWSTDGESLLISANRNEDWRFDPRNSEIYEIPLDGGDIIALTDRAGPDAAPALSPDGSMIAYVGNDDDGLSYLQNRLYVMNRDGSGKRVLAAGLDRSVGSPHWAEDGDSILVQYTDEGAIKIARVELDGDREVIVEDAGGLSLGRPYAAGMYVTDGDEGIVYTISDPQRPADLAFADLDGDVRRLTRLNEDLLGHKTLGAVEEIRFPSSHDQREIAAWIITPPDFDSDKQYPLVLEIHGGPYAAYGPHFSAELQLLASQGYIVVYANPRGSTSYGAEFANLIHQNYPSEDYDDLISAVDAVIGRGNVDEDRLYVTGGSGGGVLSAWIVGKTDRFAAAVVAKPVINWISGALTTDIAMVFTKYWMPGMPWEIPDMYWDYSPLSLVGNVTTPTMVLTGESDYRTPISESEQYYQALQLQEVESMMVRIPDTSHGIVSRPSNLIRKIKYIDGWFSRYGAHTDGED